MDEEKFIRSAAEAADHLADKMAPSQPFGGEAGEPVPEVDADDVKAIWQTYREAQDAEPGRHIAIDSIVLEKICKPGANVQAVVYRQCQLHLLKTLAEQHVIPKESMDSLTTGGEYKDSVFQAIAKISMEWIGRGRREGLPFDVEGFLQAAR
jgi:hypothetical protein